MNYYRPLLDHKRVCIVHKNTADIKEGLPGWREGSR